MQRGISNNQHNRSKPTFPNISRQTLKKTKKVNQNGIEYSNVHCSTQIMFVNQAKNSNAFEYQRPKKSGYEFSLPERRPKFHKPEYLS